MLESTIFYGLIIAGFLLAAATFVSLFFIVAPYGRHTRGGWGPTIPSRLGWIVMETPAPLVFALCFALGRQPAAATAWAFLAMWQAHYLHRAFIYPWQRRGGQRRMPLAVVAMGMAFNAGNAYVNGRYLFTFSGGYPQEWLLDVRFLIGLVLFGGGFALNRWADHTLRNLRRPGEEGYRIPHGGMYRWVSCPNYLGEVLEWTGWAVATWSLPGLAFAVWTAANLLPRAWAHHRWYRQTFPDYPPERRAVIPGLW